jgi:hypothetical protein
MFALVVAAALLVHHAPRPLDYARKSASPEAATPSTKTLPVRPDLTRPGRSNYRYSVIPRGAYSAQEFEAAFAVDPVVRAHYAVFDRTKLRMARAQGTRLMYASYRKGDSVYWTSHRVRIAANEMLITDGSHLARARCGNRLADEVQAPVARVAPAVRDLDELEAPPESTRAMLREEGAPPASTLAHGLFPSGVLPISGWFPEGSGGATYAAYATPGSVSGGPIAIVGVPASALTPQPVTEIAAPSGNTAPFQTDVPVERQTFQIWNPGSAYYTDPSFGPFGFTNGGWQAIAQGNGGPISLSPTLPMSGNDFVPLSGSPGGPGWVRDIKVESQAANERAAQ